MSDCPTTVIIMIEALGLPEVLTVALVTHVLVALMVTILEFPQGPSHLDPNGEAAITGTLTQGAPQFTETAIYFLLQGSALNLPYINPQTHFKESYNSLHWALPKLSLPRVPFRKRPQAHLEQAPCRR